MYWKKISPYTARIYTNNKYIWSITKSQKWWYVALKRFKKTRFKTKLWAFYYLKSKFMLTK